MLTWTPDPDTAPWHDVQADEVWAKGPIVAADDAALLTVTGYSCELIGPRPLKGLRIKADASGVTASAPLALADAFPPLGIEYQIKGVTGQCATFADLPAEADEIIRFSPNPANSEEWVLRVTAHAEQAQTGGAPRLISADFVLRVWANYNPGRDALKEAVNARRG